MKSPLPEKTKEYIEDYVEMRVHATIQKNEEMIGSLMRELRAHLQTSSERYDSIMKEIHKVSESGKPVEEWFLHMTWFKKGFMWLLVALGSIAATYISLKTGIIKDIVYFLHRTPQ